MTTNPYDGAALVAVLPCADLDRAELWYGRVGFTVEASHPDYRILGAGATQLHLRLQDGLAPGDSEAGVYLYAADLDALHRLHATWAAAGATILAPPTEQPHGLVEFASEDPDGNLWRVGAPLTPAPADSSVGGGEAHQHPEPRDDQPGSGGGPAGTDPTDDVVVETDWFAVVSVGHCEECGSSPSTGAPSGLGAQIRDEAHRWTTLLRPADDDRVRQRPAPEVWSALEYGAHVRDVLAVFTDRVLRTLAETEPELGWWDHEAAIDDGFANESDREAVGDDLDANAARLADVLAMVSGDQWERTATRRDHERFTVELLARFALHEVVHHRSDAEAALRAAEAPTTES